MPGVKQDYDSPIVDDEDFMDESDEEITEDDDEEESEEVSKSIPYRRFRQVTQKNRAMEEQLSSALKRLERLEAPITLEKDELDELEDENARLLFKKRFEKVEKKYANRLEALEKQIRRQEAALANPEIRENSRAIEKMRNHYLQKSGIELPDEVLLDLVKKSRPKKRVEEDVEETPAPRHNAQRKVPLGGGGAIAKGNTQGKKKDPLADVYF